MKKKKRKFDDDDDNDNDAGKKKFEHFLYFRKILFFRKNWKSDRKKKKFDDDDDNDDDVGEEKTWISVFPPLSRRELDWTAAANGTINPGLVQ